MSVARPSKHEQIELTILYDASLVVAHIRWDKLDEAELELEIEKQYMRSNVDPLQNTLENPIL